MQFFAQNLTYLRTSKNLKQAEMQAAIGFPQTTWNNYEKGRSKPNLEDLIKISKYFDIGETELLHADLEKGNLIEAGSDSKKGNLKGNVNGNLIAENEASNVVNEKEVYYLKPAVNVPPASMPKVITIDTAGDENVVMVPVRARAGYLMGYGDTDFIEKLPAFKLPGLRAGTHRIFEVEGISMFNTLQDRDLVIARWVDVTEIREDRIHVIVTKDQGVLIKRVLKRFGEGKIICKSDHNERGLYPNIVLDMNDVLEVWYVIERMTKHLPSPGEIYKRITDLEADMTLIKQKLLNQA